VRFQTAGVVEASDVAEIQELVARAEPGGVRPIGTVHSFSTVADGSDGTLQVRAPGGPEAVSIASDRSAVQVPAGIRYGDLAPLLDAQGLALANLASLAHISVGGSVATGTHGSGVGNGSLAT